MGRTKPPAPNTPLTFQERKFIELHLKKGASGCSIARELERGTTTIHTEIKRNGGRKKYTAIKSWSRSQEIYHKKYENVRNKLKKVAINPYTSMKTRIENIEMQLEIVTETLKEMKKCQKQR